MITDLEFACHIIRQLLKESYGTVPSVDEIREEIERHSVFSLAAEDEAVWCLREIRGMGK